MSLPNDAIAQLNAELNALDQQFLLDHAGKELKASQCYYLGTNPLHILFNTNCPDEIRQKVDAIVSKYLTDESSAHL